MRGYLGKPAETAQALAGGHLHTGDVAYQDADGYVFIVDRIKDVILTGGFNVYPRNVEEAIYLHPAVEECVVAGVPDAYRGQAVKAWIKLAPGRQLSRDELRAFLEDKLSHVEMPRLVEFRDQPLPKTMIGKLSRKDLLAEEAAAAAIGSGGMTDVVIAGYARSPFQPAHKGSLARVRPDELAAQVIAGADRAHGDRPAGDRGRDRRLRLPRGRAGTERRAADRLPGRDAGARRGHDRQPVLRLVDAGRAHGGRGDRDGRRRGLRLRRGRIDDPRAGHGLQPDAPSRPRGEVPPGLRRHGRDRREPGPRRTRSRGATRRSSPRDSHRKAAAAQAAGRLAAEIVPVRSGDATIEQDGCIRPETTVERLAELKPAFDAAGTVTAGTSSPLTDGASAVLVTSGAFARAHGLQTLARVRGIAVAGCAPEIMGIGPVPAAQKALERAGVRLEDMDLIELNEAFAAQALAVVRTLGIDEGRLNPDGGAIALGHPLGASGARITGKAAALLQREGKSLALATMCIGGGQGIATVLEAV